jgi:hypothetical protein
LSASSSAGKLSEDLSEFSQDELAAILAEWLLWARDDQLPPETATNGEPWRVWLVMGGGDEPPNAGYVAARQVPWPGGVAIYGSPETTGYALKSLAAAPATMGVTLDDLPARGACCMACVSA